MSKWAIFDDNGNLNRLADTDTKKDNFISGQTIYTAKTVTDDNYNSLRKREKIATLSSDTVSFTNVSVDYPSDLADIKQDLKDQLDGEIGCWESLYSTNIANAQSIINALKAIDVDAITEAPSVVPTAWFLTHTGVTKSHLEIL